MWPKKLLFNEPLELAQAGKEKLVLDDAVLDSCGAGVGGEAESGCEVVSERLFAVNMLAGCDGEFDAGSAEGGDLRVEVDGVVGVGESGAQVGRPARDVMLARDLLEFG
jgi:hypothetical protein